MSGLLLLSLALAAFPGERFGEALALGAHVVIPLDGEGKVGAGIDIAYQVQWYTQRSGRFDGDFIVWAEEHPAPNYGPMWRLSYQNGALHQTLAARAGVAWPLRVGLNDAWLPGPGVFSELGLGFSTAGHGGIHLGGGADATWLEGRVTCVYGDNGVKAPQLHLGTLVPTRFPENPYPFDADQWRAPE